ncbi:MAG: sulfatase, partial [Halanaerobiales bacterium]
AYYYASISYVDYLTGLVIEELDNKGILGDTLVIFLADHGDYAGEFGIMGKTGNFYDCLTHIPFIMTGKGLGIMSGERIEPLVELIDLMPTIAEACGVQISDNVQGSSRLSLARGKTNQGAETVFSETSGPGDNFNYQPDPDSVRGLASDPHSTGPFSHQMQGVMIRKGDMKLVYYSDGSKELYNLKNDPDEKNNIVDHSSYQPVVNELMELLLQKQINTFMPDIPQKPLAYHYRAFSMDSLPDNVIKERLEWERINKN